MKKLLLILSLFLIVGCGKNKSEKFYESYDEEYYKIYTPYKERVGSYSLKTTNSINLKEVESMLMELSEMYFDKEKLYYQEGQYLDNDFLKKILNECNDFTDIKISNTTIKPKYITAIFEQNYLNKEGNLNGISLGIVINPYQAYTNSYGSTLYKTMDEKQVLKYVEEKISTILSSIRAEYDLNAIKILVGLFVQPSPNSMMPGVYKKYGVTNNNDIDFKETDYQYYDLDNISKIDTDNYQIYENLKKEMLNISPTIYVSGYSLYRENKIEKMTINITYNNTNRSTILYLNQVLSQKIMPNFSSNINIKVYIKNNNEITSMLFKEKNTIQSSIYLVD